MSTENFHTKGLIIKELNYLEIYIYDKWGEKVLPEINQGDEFLVIESLMKEGKTTPPNLLTEATLIG